MTTSDSKSQRDTANENEWQWMTASGAKLKTSEGKQSFKMKQKANQHITTIYSAI